LSEREVSPDLMTRDEMFQILSQAQIEEMIATTLYKQLQK
jgi:hypothetical protein